MWACVISGHVSHQESPGQNSRITLEYCFPLGFTLSSFFFLFPSLNPYMVEQVRDVCEAGNASASFLLIS